MTSINELRHLIFLSTLQIPIKCSRNIGRRTLDMLITGDFLDITQKVLPYHKNNVFKFIISLHPALLLGHFKPK